MANLTKKQWNTLSSKTRKDIIYTIYGENLPQYYQTLVYSEYKHDFDYNQVGKRLKHILSQCRVQSDGTIDVVVTINPAYAPKASTKPAPTENKLSTWYVDYEDKSGDLCHIWVEATSKEDARSAALDEYWDIKEITQIRKG